MKGDRQKEDAEGWERDLGVLRGYVGFSLTMPETAPRPYLTYYSRVI